MPIKAEMDISYGEVAKKLKGKFTETLRDFGGELGESGERAFEELLRRTVGQEGTGIQENWRRDHGFLYEVTGRIARRALRAAAKDGSNAVTWRHVADSANCLVPDISYYCHKDAPVETRWQTRGPYCRDYEDMDPNAG